MAYVDEF